MTATAVPPPSHRITGTVTLFTDDRGFGFVNDDADPSRAHYVHVAEVAMEAPSADVSPLARKGLTVGQKLEFEMINDATGRTKAVKVTAVGGGPLPFTEARPSLGPRRMPPRRYEVPYYGMPAIPPPVWPAYPSPYYAPPTAYGAPPYGPPPPTVPPAATPIPGGRVRGMVAKWNDNRGFGFVQEEGPEQRLFYVHHTGIRTDPTSQPAAGMLTVVPVGQEVEFQVIADQMGRTKAVEVTGPGGVLPNVTYKPPALPVSDPAGPAAAPGQPAAAAPPAPQSVQGGAPRRGGPMPYRAPPTAVPPGYPGYGYPTVDPYGYHAVAPPPPRPLYAYNW